jgi:hypothetical protein
MKNRETTLSGEQFETVLSCLRDKMISLADDIKKVEFEREVVDDEFHYNSRMIMLTSKMSCVSALYYDMVTQCDYVQCDYVNNDGQTNNG